MTDDTPRRQRKPSGPESAAEPKDPGADSPTPETAPAPPDGGDSTGEGPSVASLLADAEHLLVNIQVASPNPELNKVRALIGQAAELAGSGDDG